MAKKKPVEEEEEGDVDEEEKEEANRLKTLAEEKYKLSNFKSALKYSKRAQRLHPNLQGISDMVTTFNILDIASKASSSSSDDSLPDWYKILEVEPFSHINSIKKQYKKLALILHPDKNTCIASEEAFKYVGEAFRVLSDKIKRKDYDLKFRNALQSKVIVSDVTPVSRVDTFWTKCSTCRLFHQFERRYMGQSLMCPSCKKSFLAVETVVDDELDDKTRVKGKGRSGGGSSFSEKNDRKESVGGSENITRKREASDSISDFFDRMGLRSPSNKKAKKIIPEMTLAEMQLEETKKRPEKTLAEMQSEVKRKVLREKRKMKEVVEKAENIKGEQNKIEEKRNNNKEREKEKAKEKVKENEKKGKANEKEKVKEKVNEKEKVKENEKKGKANEKEKEMEKVKEKVMAKEKVKVLAKEKEKEKVKEKEKEKVSENEKGKASEKEKDKVKEKEKVTRKEKAKEKVKEKEDRQVTVSETSRNLEVMVVEDSDFYNFDKDRMERSFKKGQVWAVYDDDDGMPRHYGLIDEVVSVNPFEVKMSWLDLQNSTDEGLIPWHRSVSYISCGRFKVAKKTDIDSVNFFSHPVECERVAREVYRIYPKKGSIWALYRERDLDGDEAEPISGDNRCYDIVVFLTSYSEMHGLSMAYLEKVEGFKTIFKRREIGCHAIRWFEKDNVRLFSHQIPARKLSGKETPDLSKDCWELDPASLSPNLLIMTGE